MTADVLYARLLGRPTPVRARDEQGAVRPIALHQWLGPTTATDERVAAMVTGPVIDVGCGPGRLLDALARHGRWAIGLDLSPAAVSLARRQGRRAVLGDIFAEVPGAGSWRTALLLDGNVGIGGDPVALLLRLRSVLRPGGTVVAEVEPPGAPSGSSRVRLEAGDHVSDWFAWGRVGVDGIADLAHDVGMAVTRTVEMDGRWFTCLA